MILHLCNDFSGSKVYSNLYKKLDDLNYDQIIFHPLRNFENIGKNGLDFRSKKSQIYYSRLVKKHHKLLFRNKVRFLYDDLKKIDCSSVSICFATTLFSDGAIAHRLYIEKNIPYIVTVRHTDVNLFLKLRPDLIGLGLKILRDSKKIIFISEALRRKFLDHSKINDLQNSFIDKIVVIPNGIDDFWIRNINQDNQLEVNKFLFIGKFDKNKNIIKLIKALQLLRIKHTDIQLDLVGGGGNTHDKVISLIENLTWCTYHGKIRDKNELLKIFRKNKYFAMPSIFETFGLVYIEAISQGLPVIFTKGQGIDGLFEFPVGESSKPDIKSIYKACEILMNSHLKYNLNKINFDMFDWNKIALKYENIIKSIK